MWMQSKLGAANCRCTSIKILVSKGVCKRLTPVTAKRCVSTCLPLRSVASLPSTVLYATEPILYHCKGARIAKQREAWLRCVSEPFLMHSSSADACACFLAGATHACHALSGLIIS